MVKLINLFLLFITFSYSQETVFNEQDFFKNMQESYYSLNTTDKNNFTVLLTNLRTEQFAAEQWKNSEIFPLQLIWFSSDRMFLSEQGVPALNDSAKNVYTNLVMDLKKQITGVLFDLKRFYFNGVYSSISSDYSLKINDDVVQIDFSTNVENDTTFFSYFFGKNGLCLKIETVTPANNLRVETYPNFKIVKTKWLITGWEVQMSKNGEIYSGLTIKLNNTFVSDVWVPQDMIITVQKTEAKGTTFSDLVKFRNFLFNQPLQFIEQSK
ncbi:MAG: hypothetical protein H6627_03745 [Calditrichae bacterium]|nr:hypothetical protein [Calditrichota bacterium]MCB9057653.1 hypothetical protein [Calditrichia bacterium]